ncbi:MAG: hypothetical protein WC417_01870 [Candidatus Omnitrophota bacterium]|jgi:hypothetical protein
MPENIENLIRIIYKNWKVKPGAASGAHPDEEVLAAFLEGKLPEEEGESLKAHLLSCNLCIESLIISLTEAQDRGAVPQELLDKVRNTFFAQESAPLLEIALKLKDRFLELLNSTGDILVGQELLPAPVLRSRSIGDFKDEVTIFKDFKEIRVEVKVENKGGKHFNLHITASEKLTQKIIKNLRVTLMSEECELESYLTDSGSVIFEHVMLGKYKLAIASLDHNLASILLDIKI